ncbi:hypothetical protein EXE46_03765 [Halorubrum sp. GN11_10-6_MGM]|uniref:DUF7261 family protein n=1 Tax=Halorubrum sp. GN11_10-6_MGM TaxID=2518112 RepID=UPI0010F59B24|nr:hypothetical protein [Halorubrum sp. GN11_10-6_MGM]TKX75573.1 hypothetical protein EXE46_03765 [Halorubrum sp. GN11_10-6_MGM]
MADVNSPRRCGRENGDDADEDRAQIILITGLTLAVLFVAVVLLLNTVIYTENLATRGADAGGAEAIEFRDGVTNDLAGILHREHRNASDGDVFTEFNASAETYARTVADIRARDGVIADVQVKRSTLREGHFVAQNETASGLRNMTAPDGSTANWTVVNDTNRTRNFRLTVNSSSLSGGENGAFAVVADGADEDWSVTLSNDSADAIDVRVRNATVNTTRTFSHEGVENVTIDLTAGTVGGERFPELVWAGGVQSGSDPYDAYDIRYENGDEATGTYDLVVDERDGSAPLDASSRPYVTDAIYSVEVELRHRTPGLTYGDVVRLAPGERDA